MGTCLNRSLLYLASMVLILFAVFLSVAHADDDEEEDYTPVFTASNPVPNNMLQTGSLTKRIPIKVPPGRNGMTPELSLQYSSANTQNGWLGVGWGLNIDFIQRSTKRGLDYGANDFVFGNDELIAVSVEPSTGAGAYRAKIENDFKQFIYDPYDPDKPWTVRYKDGTVKYFGQTDSSLQDNTHGVFRWYLSKVEDANGNSVVYDYEKDAEYGAVYPLEINYTYHGETGAHHRIEFIKDPESRTDIAPSYQTHSEVKIVERLKRIEIFTDDQPVYQYVLDYDYGENSKRSRLKSVQLFGNDASTALPQTVFEYTAGGDGTFKNLNSQSVSDMKLGSKAFGDFDGDGYTDVVFSGDSWFNRATHKIWVSFSQGDGSFLTSALLSDDDPFSRYTMYPLAGDINADGNCDIVMIRIGWFEEEVSGDFIYICYPHYQAFISNGDRTFQALPVEPFTTGGSNISWEEFDYGKAFLSDINGDGQSDLQLSCWYLGDYINVNYLSDGSGIFSEQCKFNVSRQETISIADVTGDGRGDLIALSYTNSGSTPIIQNIIVYTGKQNGSFGEMRETSVEDWCCNSLRCLKGHDMYALFADINGDGLTDVYHRKTGNIYFSKGDGTFDGPNVSNLEGKYHSIMNTGDINGDGYTDIIGNDSPLGGAKQLYIYLSKGDGSFQEEISFQPASLYYNTLVDINGDGKSDFVTFSRKEVASYPNVYKYIGNFYTYLSNGDNPPDLLTSVNNGLGYSATIDYTDSSKYPNKCLPFVVHPVETITETDGITSSHTTTYSYADGDYNFKEREFRGFGTVSESLPNDSTKTSLYHLDAYRKGRVYQVDLTDTVTETLLSRTTFDWAAVDEEESWGFVSLDKKRVEIYDGDTTVFSQEEYDYDDYGNLELIEKTGSGAEKISIENDYVNYGTWLWRKTHETVTGEETGVARETGFDYESGTGNLQYYDQYLDGLLYARTRYEYDDYGNRAFEYDPKGNPPTKYIYDATDTYPEEIINPKGHTTNKEWDLRYGTEKWTRDANQQTTTYTPDQFGRLVQVDLPDGGKQVITYNDYCLNGECDTIALPVKTLSQISTDDGSTIDTYTYHDGLGRKVQSVTNGEDDFIVTKTHYDAMGRVAFESGPFFQSDASFLGAAQWTAYSAQGYDAYPGFDYPYVHTTYDKQGRPLVKSSWDGQNDLVTTGFVHNGYTTTTTDPDLCVRKQISDHLDRIIEVVDDPDGEDIHTTYLYNAAGDLTEVRNALYSSESPDDNRIKMEYDTLGRKRWMDDPDLGSRKYEYDTNGNLTIQATKFYRIKFDHDELNRVTSKEYPDTTEPTVTYTYDSTEAALCIGRLYQVTNGNVTTAVTAYDPMGRELTVQKSISGAATRTMAWDYDIAGPIRRLTYPYTEGSDPFYVDHDYHPGTSLLHTVTGSNDAVFAKITQYKPTGKMGLLQYGNDVSTLYGYDGWSQRLTSYKTTKADGEELEEVYQDREYIYTGAGDIAHIDDLIWGENYTYGYDKLHRLAQETTSNASIGVSPGIFDFEYNDPDHLHAVSEITSLGQPHAFEYDANGNMTDGPDLTDPLAVVQRNLVFNADNMPDQITHPTGGTMTLVYDGEGTRAKKTSASGETYYFSNEFELREGKATCYIFAGNFRVAMVENNRTVRYFHKDHLGSSSVITLADGSMHEQTRYLPFGGQRGEGAGIMAAAYQFTDQELDGEIGLYNYDARLYDPMIGKFVSADSIVPDPTYSQSFNRYTYVLNNPLIYVDPTGYDPEGEIRVTIPDMTVTASREPSLFINSLGQIGWFNSWNGSAVTVFDPSANLGIGGGGYTGPPDLFAESAFFQPGDFVPVGLGATVLKGAFFKFGAVGTIKLGVRKAASKSIAQAEKNLITNLANQELKGGATQVGRALQKHSARSGSWLEGLAHGGNNAQNTLTANKLLSEIVENGTVTTSTHKVFGNVTKVRMPDGRGFWYSSDRFIGFLERYTPK